MQDIISMLHRGKLKLFDTIEIGNYRLSIQTSKYHNCKPKKDNLPAYMYDEFDVAVYDKNDRDDYEQCEAIPPAILHELEKHNNGYYLSNITKQQLQWLYNNLYQYSKIEMDEMWCKLYDDIASGNLEYEQECIEQCILTHEITNKNDKFWKNIAMRRMLLMMYGVK